MNSAAEQSRLARGTGRSYVLSDMVMPGDLVVFATQEHADDFLRLQYKRGRTTRYSAVTHDPEAPLSELLAKIAGRAVQRMFYDHVWLERYYAAAVIHDMNQIVNLSKRVAHEEL